jgi:DNA-binding transcriptional LysR family regulator
MSTILAAINLNRLTVFTAVVESGSLTAAASRLGVAKAAVSTHLKRLEAELGASLLVRTTRGMHLTEAGETFYGASRQIVRDSEAAVLAVGQSTKELRGTLRVTAPIDYGCSVVAPVLVELRKRHPSLRAELRATDHLLDLVGEGIDVAIRFGKLADSSMRAIRISTFEEWLVAAPDFIGKSSPSTPQDVRRLPFVALSVLPHPQSWKFDGPGKSGSVMIQFEAAMTTNTAHAVRSAVIAGGGLGVLPNVIGAEDVGAGRLVRLLPKWKLPSGGIYAVFPGARHQPQKAKAFIAALATYARRPPNAAN